MAELKVIAEHEALHLLVNLLGITDNTDLLAHFADLKGFDTFSRERFLLITKGIILPENHEENKEDGKFFAFIDERNFLQGMKGGHSHQNPDEFCASFIHSLMYVDGLLKNLARPLIMNGCSQPYYLTQIEKRGILKDYLNTLDILARAVAGRKKTEESFDKVNEVLEQIYFKAKCEQERCEIRKLIPKDGTTGFSPTCFTLLKPSD